MNTPDMDSRRYGKWAGNPKGTAENVKRCIEEIPVGGRSVLFRQCPYKRGKGKDGLYCGVHAKRNPEIGD